MNTKKPGLAVAVTLLLTVGMATPSQADVMRIGGTWVCNSSGRVRLIAPVTPGNLMLQVEQKGPDLVFMDETGKRADGGFQGYDGIYAENGRYGNRGHIGINVDGSFFRKRDAEEKFSGTPERDREWNFIRWEDGTLCVRARSR
jgi:hypothetical protein